MIKILNLCRLWILARLSLFAFHRIVSYDLGMTNQPEIPSNVERSTQVMFAATIAGIFLVAGTVTKNERAVFLTEGSGLPAKAFAAMIPPGAAVYRTPYAPYTSKGPSRRGASGFAPDRLVSEPRSARLINSLLGQPANPVSGFSQPGIPGAASLTDPATADQTQLASLAPSQFTPTVPRPSGGGAAGAAGSTTPQTPPTPVAPTTPVTATPPVTQGNPGIPTNPATPAAPTAPTGSATPSNPVSAVPESATWEMLLMGFLAIGLALRRKSAAAGVFGSGRI